ncbi:MAG: elongation factor P [Flavobacteriales bacterium]|jgi:elongation factor P|nr:elongation factor P [Flavobacteriales bacterium]MBT6013525.1 elongation factor P [Flavobacteriales bacterium]MBT7481591.1 elongation factor P [Flavobacteriales bacterium]
MATTADFRNGLCIQFNGDPWKIESFQHVKPGKGPAFVRTKIRNLNTGRLLENTFTSGVKIEVIRIENRKYQFLYAEGEDCHLMNLDDYEQIMLGKNFIENVQFLKDGENVNVLFHADEGMPLSASLPSHIVLEISHTEPGIKGNTATNTFKPATTETGASIQVPLFINEGDKIKIDTEKGAYLERVKE